jgi:hypothetical protein
MRPAERAPLRLQADQAVDGRGFSDPAHTARDGATLAQLRVALARAAAGPRAAVLDFADDIGEHCVAVPDWRALETVRPVAVVGFFGQARDGVDHTAIVDLEHDIVARAAAFPGLLAYHNAKLATGQWGNLVVFATPAHTARVTGDPAHADALARTPQHYASLRLHRGTLADGCLGAAPVRIGETLYLDFAETPPWRAVRAYSV